MWAAYPVSVREWQVPGFPAGGKVIVNDVNRQITARHLQRGGQSDRAAANNQVGISVRHGLYPGMTECNAHKCIFMHRCRQIALNTCEESAEVTNTGVGGEIDMATLKNFVFGLVLTSLIAVQPLSPAHAAGTDGTIYDPQFWCG